MRTSIRMSGADTRMALRRFTTRSTLTSGDLPYCAWIESMLQTVALIIGHF